jgi:hypothetical protein
MATIPEEVTSLLKRLPPSDQQRVLDYARRLAGTTRFPRTPLPPGTAPDVLLRITVSPEIGEAMERALENCERIDADELSSASASGGVGVFLLDSSVLIRSLRGDSIIRARLTGTTVLYLPSGALGELYFGAYGSPTRTADAIQDVNWLAAGMTIVAVDATTAQIYGQIGNELKV